MVGKIISGGQTGVDRAALDFALESGIPCGGWCPRGRRAEDGPIPEAYPLKETPAPVYPQRTAWNVRDSDGTLILTRGGLSGGTALTEKKAKAIGMPHWIVDMDGEADIVGTRAWLRQNRVEVLNVAGPRESENLGIHDQALAFLRALRPESVVHTVVE
ncbi:MAG: putative molybdenum carrier protein [Magnetococcales bacterium]|nr:putative molybdenum carrier protein [Magnetococcales bacterium]